MRSETYMSKINLQRGKLTVENRKSREKKRVYRIVAVWSQPLQLCCRCRCAWGGRSRTLPRWCRRRREHASSPARGPRRRRRAPADARRRGLQFRGCAVVGHHAGTWSPRGDVALGGADCQRRRSATSQHTLRQPRRRHPAHRDAHL